MTIPDVNLLLYAQFADSAQHASARAWWEATLSGLEPVGLPWSVLHAFVRLATNSRIMHPALEPSHALEMVASWLQRSNVMTLVPGPRHWPLFQQMMREGQCRGPLSTDASLAALALEHGAEFCTTDRDFSRFPGLRWRNPLLPS
ncbi:MAG TPA: type II toxin-antitoxin system VapC family toxin [Terriglobales bacterium]|nr:type II toxin-antitoxin system VapC family toxin [Terriglobales bacterium]